MNIKKMPVLWHSEHGNIAVAYNKFDLGAKYKVFQKVEYLPEKMESWECIIAFHTIGESVEYAQKIYDEAFYR